MFKTIIYTVLAKRLCRETSVIGKGEYILLIKEDGQYKTLMQDPTGLRYWIKSFYGYDQALKNFNDRIDDRVVVESLYHKLN
jgi:hypothetical protein